MRLADLAKGDGNGVRDLGDLGGTDVTGLTCDSRKVQPGFLFAAFPGARADGRRFIADAVARGAVAILSPPAVDTPVPSGPARVITADNPRRAFALMAARFYQEQPAAVAAVTGTNGKTSTVSFLRQMWTRLGRRAASLGTLGVAGPGISIPGSLTTPDPVDLHRTLAELAHAGVSHLAMEASSHGLSQFRLDGVRVAAAAFTNLTRDHLDYHQTMDAYLAAKLRLFAELATVGGTAVVNADDGHAAAFIGAARRRALAVLAYGARGADLRLVAAEPLAEGQRLTIEVLGRRRELLLPLVGAFQATNALCALALAIATGEDAEAAADALAGLEGVRGRLQACGRHANGAPVYVDYAHTPDALETILRTLRPHVAGRLVVVFGCGGDRDAGKRPEMGRIACELADVVFVTDDNPRSEEPASIRGQIMAACTGATEIGDRRKAIRTAVAALKRGDLLVVAGKGHESGQIVGAKVLPFDDATVVGEALAGVGQ